MSSSSTTPVANRGPSVFAVTVATLALATAFVVARGISRIGIVRKVSADDYIIFIAWVFAFFLSFTISLGTFNGLGLHDADIDPNKRPVLHKAEYVFSVLYNPSLMATKTSILVFYLRLARDTQVILKWASWFVLVVVNIAGTILTFMNIFQCVPISSAWDPTEVSERCIPLLTEFICAAPVNIITDLAILALPIPVLTGMRLPPRQKTILVLTFALGIFVTVVDVVRIYYLQQAIEVTSPVPTSDVAALFGDSVEFAWNGSRSLMWSAVEVNVGITCACIPTLKPLVIRILPAMLVDPNGTWRSRSQRSRANTSVAKQESDSNQTATGTDSPAEHKIRRPSSVHAPEPTPGVDRDMSLMDFLSSPESAHPADLPTRAPLVSLPTTSTIRSSVGTGSNGNAVYFGFVNLRKPKSMLRTSIQESWKYCTVVSVLFFLWGFSYGLLNSLNNAIADVANMEMAETLGLTSIYFGGGYFFGPLLVGEWILRHDEHRRLHRGQGNQPDSLGGFKTTFIAGLLIYGTGTIMFWPSAVLTAFGGFMVSSFVVGFGLGVLETAANPFLALCGPIEYAEMRLLLAQGVQAVGSVLSGLLADNIFFESITQQNASHRPSLLDVQWTYLAITLLCVLLALFFYYMPLPEVSDGALGRLADDLPVNPKKKVFGGISLRTWAIILAVTAQWMYVAAQETMSIYFENILNAFVVDPITGHRRTLVLSTGNFLMVAHTAFAVSRFTSGLLAYLVVKFPRTWWLPTPRTILAVSTVGTVVFAILTVVVKPWANPNLIFVPLVLFFLAEGPLWPLIFALGLRGQGRRTKRAAAWLTMGGSGPMFWPFVVFATLRSGAGIQTSLILLAALLAVCLGFPIFLTFSRDARAMVDPPTDRPGRPHDTEAGDPGTGDISRTVTEPDLNAILAQRRRESAAFPSEKRGSDSTAVAGDSTGGGADLAHDRQEQQQEQVQARDMAPRSKSNSDATTLTGGSGSGGPRAPWEDQVLDTTILDD